MPAPTSSSSTSSPATQGRSTSAVTDDLQKRTWEHKNKVHEGFTSERNIHRLLYWEEFIDIRTAIAREKQLKGWTRKKKIALFERKNPVWRDLSKGW